MKAITLILLFFERFYYAGLFAEADAFPSNVLQRFLSYTFYSAAVIKK